jgi:hypothetical protein
MTEVQCECGQFKATIESFPKQTAGRCVCYCDDCQTYLYYLGKENLLDPAGGTEIIPVYPKNFKVLQGQNLLKCVRLSEKGLYRWYVSCCKTPIGNVVPKFPWVGTINRIYTSKEPKYLENSLGKIKSRIYGKYSKGPRPEGLSDKTSFKDLKAIIPFVFNGFLKGKAKPSPFFEGDGTVPISEPQILSTEERNKIREKIGFPKI